MPLETMLKDASPVRVSTVEQITYVTLLFCIPFAVREPQVVVGSIINTVLVLATARGQAARFMLIACLLPSLAVLTAGMLFGPLTSAIVVMIPFIWSGNACICAFAARARAVNKNRLHVAGVLMKVAIIAAGALAMVGASLLPVHLLPSFTTIQLTTASIGTVSGLAVNAGLMQHANRRVS